MTTLSNRQFPMLEIFVLASKNYIMSIEQAKHFDQRPFRSMLIREWITYDVKRKGFILTSKGQKAWIEFHETSIERKDFSKPLTAYFDAKLYRLKA